jgi:hypothetical protein
LTLLKSIVACLVLANVGYFLWARGVADSPQPVTPPAAAAATSLKLASESTVRRPTVTEAGGGVAIDGGGTGNAGNRNPSAVTGSSGAISAGSGSADAPVDVAGAALLSNVKRCISVGPFREVTEAAHAAATLRAAHYDPRQRAAEGEVWAGVWVYLPTPAGRGAADPILAKLKAGGIDDALEMPGPNDSSVISLGLFSEPKRAQARVAQAQAMGLNPGIADRKRTGNVYWIDID